MFETKRKLKRKNSIKTKLKALEFVTSIPFI